MTDARQLSATELDDALVEARRAMLATCLDLDDEQWWPPYTFNVQPVAWDLGHVGWFHEFWQLRGPHSPGTDGFQAGSGPPRWFGPDAHYDSARIAHRARWHIELLPRDELLARLAQQLERCRARLAADPDPTARYFAWLGAMHELMHVEARAWTRSALRQPPPPDTAMARVPERRDVHVPAGRHHLGTPDGAFAFDNEAPPEPVDVAAFTIDSHPVRNDAFAEFVLDGGYRRAELWPDDAGRFRERARRELPERWRRAPDGGFEHRFYDRWLPLPADEPVVHVNAYEAEAFCRWAGRRLPSAAEWEVAAAHVSWGRSVWEWTADPFAPRPGFRPGPYNTYSAPWFHHQRELRGGAYATHALMHDRRYRNFFLPWRTDVFAGFRTAAVA